MNDKIRQLTDKLYEEGLQKGKEESDKLIAQAKAEAAKILSDAKQQSQEIVEQAKKRDAEMQKTAMKDVEMAASRAMNDLKESIKDMLSSITVSQDITQNFSNTEFVASLISTIVENWSKQNQEAAISVSVPENAQTELEKYISAKTFSSLKSNLEIKSDKKVLKGFRISSSDKGFYVSFTDEEFNNFFAEYLREKVSKLVFPKE